MANRSYIRTGTILRKRYTQFMIPAMLSAIGVSLNEFADSMIVGNLIGPEAFSIINLCLPIVLIASTIYTITGIGGSLLYAEYLGKKKKKNADNCFSASVIFSVLIGVAAVGLLLILHSHLSTFFGCPADLKPQFDLYISVLYFFMPAAIVLMNFTFFLPVVGFPFLSMGLIVSANILNIVLDVVIIRGFGTGCEGAALATLISFVVCLAVGILICRIRKVPLKLTRPEKPGMYLKMIMFKGLPSGVVQAGYIVTTIFCNNFMNLAFGLIGVEAMSVFAQMDSIISIALTGITDNNASFVAMLKSEGDYFGIRTLSRRVTTMLVTVVSVICVLFAVFPGYTAGIFNVHGADALALIARLTPVYVLYYPLRCIILVLRDIYNTLDRSGYATFLGIMDKIICIPLIGGILYAAFGGYGLIAAFPASMVAILLLIVLINHRIVRRSKGRYSPVLLLDEAYPMKAICSYSTDSLEDVSEIGLMLEEGIEETERNASILDRMCLAAEEMSLYTADQCGKETPVDFMISRGKDYTLTCRSPGRPFCPIPEQSKEQSPNERLLTAMFHIKHEYIFGLNSTSLTIRGE